MFNLEECVCSVDEELGKNGEIGTVSLGAGL